MGPPMQAEVETKVIDRESKPGTQRPVTNTGGDLLASHRLVGRYELVHRLGHGGMATVYLGRAVGTAGFEKLVAVKVIHPHLASEPEFVEMFLDEARIASRLHHPHVVEILDLGRDDDVFFMVMEYVEGDTLASLLRQLRRTEERLPLAAMLQVVADACEGLAAAHELADPQGLPYDLVHRDVSPHNLLVGMDGRVKVVDFGIMKAAGKRSSTLTGQLRGKVAYMSPEQAGSKPLDHRTDVFALGAVLWEMCCGERLFSGETESETLAKVARCEVPDLLQIRSDLPVELRDILDRALAASPEHRYGSAREMLKDVRILMRKLEDEDPRATLAEVMDRLLHGRIEYIRAAARSAGDSGRAHRSSRDLSAAARVAVLRAGLEQSTPPPLADSSSSQVPVVSNTGTLTTSLASAPARHWSLWLLLPLVGAAIGTAFVSMRATSETTEPAPLEQGGTPAATVAPEPGRPQRQPAVEDEPETPQAVKWWFNTDPAGATVIVDGRRYETGTPLVVELPRGDDPVSVRIEKDGHVPLELRLAPVRAENFAYQLQPLRRTNSPLNFRARTKGSSRSRSRSAKSSAKSKDTKTDAGDDRTVPEMPNFGGSKGKTPGG